MEQVRTSLPDDLAAWVRAEARRQGVSESSVIRDAVREAYTWTLRPHIAGGKESGQ